MKEIWKDVVNFEGLYEISNLGRVRTYRTKLIRALNKDNWNYWRLSLYKQNKIYTIRVHIMVAYAFIGPRPIGFEINHIDTNKNNNRWDNLEYVTPSINILHNFKMGVSTNKGTRNPRNLLTEKQVIDLRQKLENDGSVSYRKELAKELSVSLSCINGIYRNKNWKHLPLTNFEKKTLTASPKSDIV